MKTRFVLAGMIMAAVILAGCERPGAVKDAGDTGALRRTAENLSREQARAYLEELAAIYTQDNALINVTNIERILEEESVPLSGLVEGADDQLTVDSLDYTIRVELFNETQASPLMTAIAKAGDYAFGICGDVDRLYPEEGSTQITYPTFKAVVSRMEWSMETEEMSQMWETDIDTIDDEWNADLDDMYNNLPYALFVLSLEENDNGGGEEPSEDVETASYYLTFKAVWLKVERDGNSHEEFEMWYNHPISGLVDARWKFNGIWRNDARGVNAYFNDVNKKKKWYERPDNDLTYLFKLDDEFTRVILPFEDDWREGLMDRVHYTWNPLIGYYWIKNWDTYNAGTNMVQQNIPQMYVVHPQLLLFDQDDRFSEGAAGNLTFTNVRNRTNDGANYLNTDLATGGGLDDRIYKFGLGLW